MQCNAYVQCCRRHICLDSCMLTALSMPVQERHRSCSRTVLYIPEGSLRDTSCEVSALPGQAADHLAGLRVCGSADLLPPTCLLSCKSLHQTTATAYKSGVLQASLSNQCTCNRETYLSIFKDGVHHGKRVCNSEHWPKSEQRIHAQLMKPPSPKPVLLKLKLTFCAKTKHIS